MKKYKHLFIFVAFLCVADFRCFAQFMINGINYSLNYTGDNVYTARVVKLDGRNYYSGTIIIPETVTYDHKKYSVVGICDDAFYNCSGLTSVTIPNSVTLIGNNAFYYCTKLTSVTIGNSVTAIGNYAFNNCSGLTSINIPNSVTTIGSSAFEGCSSLISINIPSFMMQIGNGTFRGCSKLASIKIPNSVTTIGVSAFSDCSSLTSINIPNSVTTIGSYTFYKCSGLTSPVYNANCFGYMPTVYKGAYTIPDGIRQIAGTAFYNCSGLTSVTIPNSVTTIGGSAFYGCSGLTSVTIPNSVTKIGENAFYDCSNLESITCSATIPPTCGSSCFYNVDKTIPVYVPARSVEAYKQTIRWEDFFNLQGFPNDYAIVTCSATNGTVSGGGKLIKGDTCILAVCPNYGYHFDHWSDGNTDNPRIFVLTQDTTFTAELARNVYSFDIQTEDTSMGAVNGTKGGYEYLTNLKVSASPNYGYHFDHWSDGNRDNPRSFVLTQDTILTAYFAKNIYSVSSTSQYGTIQGSGLYEYLEMCTIIATPDYGYHFVQWSDGNTDNPRSFIVTQDTSFMAEFAKNQYLISVEAENGVVSGGGYYEYQSYAQLTATADEHYHFVKWSDGNTSNPRNISVTEDKTYTAIFTLDQHSVSAIADHGNVFGIGTYDYGSEISLIVTPSYGYQFTQWSDGNTDNPRSFIVTQDTTFTAQIDTIWSGACGDDLTWRYNDGVLVISGTGAMYDYTQGTAPWMPLFKESISSLVINNGCTSIGNFAFCGLSNKNLKTIDIPNGVEQIGQYTFANCEYIKNVYLGLSLEKISANAFANDERLLYITCYAIEPPLLDESAFANYDVYLSVPCESQDEYKVSKGWKLFNKENVSCIGAEEKPITGDEVTVNPSADNVTITWPANDNASEYKLVITKDGIVFCTLTFNAQGQLTGIAFAPNRAGSRMLDAAVMTANGWQFTVTGLDIASKYGYALDALNASKQSIKHYEGEFATDGYTSLEWVTSNKIQGVNKMLLDGHLYILRDGNLYTATGARVK